MGGMALYCPQCELGALPDASAVIIISAVMCVYQEAKLSSLQLCTHSCKAGTTHSGT